MPTNQDTIFFESEGDQYFTRNQKNYGQLNPYNDHVLKLIELYGLKPQTILEVGAANGARLALLHKQLQAKLVAVEPSLKAIEDGKKRFPFIDFFQGIAANLPVEGVFDLVIVNFVLHWIDRKSLLRSIAEIDAHVAEGGFLIIGDFLPINPTKVLYHHLPDQKVYTFKQNYAELLLSSGLYQQVALLTGHHASHSFDASPENKERTGTWLLRKTFASYE